MPDDSCSGIRKEEIRGNKEYIAATLFSAYAAKLLGFNYDSKYFRGIEDEVDENSSLIDPSCDKMKDYAKNLVGALRSFYNEDAKSPVCSVDELSRGWKMDSSYLTDNLLPDDISDDLKS